MADVDIQAAVEQARSEGIRIGREAAAQAILAHADKVTPDRADSKRRWLHTAARVAATPIAPEQVVAALEALSRPPIVVACGVPDGKFTANDGKPSHGPQEEFALHLEAANEEIRRLSDALRVCEHVLHRAEPTDAQMHAGQQASGAYTTEWTREDVFDDLPYFAFDGSFHD